jgi:hypothetical protein
MDKRDKDFALRATLKFLPADCPFEKWRTLSHWWRMKIYGDHSPLSQLQQEFCEAIGELENPRDVSEFMTHPATATLMNTLLSIPLNYDRLEESSEIATWHMQTLMRTQGVVYSVASRLAHLLQETRLEGVSCDLVRAPHHVMFIEIPKSAGLEVYNRDTGWHPVEGAYVVETNRVYDPELWKKRREEALPTLAAGETFREIRVQVIGTAKDPDNIWDDACFNFRIRMTDPTIEEAIARELGVVGGLWGRHRDAAKKTVEGLFNFVVNILLYCTSVNADIVTRLNPAWEVLRGRAQKAKSDKKRKRLQQEMKKLDKRETKVLGSRLIVGKAPLGEGQTTSGEGTGKALTTPHMVSGHWKGVWMGSTDPDRAREIGERRKVPKWVAPYPRGDLAEQIHTTYRVDLPEE